MNGFVFRALIACVALPVSLAHGTTVKLVPTRASGTEGADWVIGPGAREITLFSPGQNVEVLAFINDFADVDSSIGAYVLTLDCASFDADSAGGVIGIPLDCINGNGVYGVDFCTGVNADEVNFVFASTFGSLESCLFDVLCPSGDPGEFRCSSVSLNSGPIDNGEDFYAAHFSFSTSSDMRGTADITLLDDIGLTFFQSVFAETLPFDEILPATITVPVGACCQAGLCQDDVTMGSCLGAGQTFAEGANCTGDADGDGVADACDVCPGKDDTSNPECAPHVPTVGAWGLIVLALSLLSAAKLGATKRGHA